MEKASEGPYFRGWRRDGDQMLSSFVLDIQEYILGRQFYV